MTPSVKGYPASAPAEPIVSPAQQLPLPRAQAVEHHVIHSDYDTGTEGEKSDAFANPFKATPSRPEFLDRDAFRSAEDADEENEDAEPLSEQKKEEANEMKQIVLVTDDKLRNLRESAEGIVANIVKPAMQEAANTGKTVAITLGRKSLQITAEVAHELLTSPYVIAIVLAGWYGHGTIPMAEPASGFMWGKLATMGRSLLGIPQPEISTWAAIVAQVKDIQWAFKAGVKLHASMKLAKSIAKEVGVLAEIKNDARKRDVSDLVGAQMEAIKALTSALQSRDVMAARQHARKLPKALQDKLSSDSEATYGPAKKVRAIKNNRRPLAIRDRNAVEEFNSVPTEARSNPTVHDLPRFPRMKIRRRGKGEPSVKQSDLVNYGDGLRQAKKGGRATIKGMEPILEHNEMADDPYVIRQPIQ